MSGQKQRTRAIKKGGQHPEWDDELRFDLHEEVDNSAVNDHGTPPPPPPKDGRSPPKIKGGKILKLACYAEDAREPDLIGEVDVDLTQVLTKGECDGAFLPVIVMRTRLTLYG